MSSSISEDLAGLPELLTQAQSLALKYLDSLSEHPVGWISTPLGNLDLALSELGLGTLETLKKFEQDILPNLSGSSGSRYWGFVIGGSTPASLVGEWLTSAIDQNVMFSGDSISTCLSSKSVEFNCLELLLQA